MTKLPQLRVDSDGYGAVSFQSEFTALSWIERADLLNDWITELTHEYNRTLDEFCAVEKMQ